MGYNPTTKGGMPMLTEQDVRQLLRYELGEGRMCDFAVKIGVDAGHLSKVLSGKAPPTGAILAHLRLKRESFYVPY
jgi:transcriptional regulator with XRE-family HTH domain